MGPIDTQLPKKQNLAQQVCVEWHLQQHVVSIANGEQQSVLPLSKDEKIELVHQLYYLGVETIQFIVDSATSFKNNLDVFAECKLLAITTEITIAKQWLQKDQYNQTNWQNIDVLTVDLSSLQTDEFPSKNQSVHSLVSTLNELAQFNTHVQLFFEFNQLNYLLLPQLIATINQAQLTTLHLSVNTDTTTEDAIQPFEIITLFSLVARCMSYCTNINLTLDKEFDSWGPYKQLFAPYINDQNLRQSLTRLIIRRDGRCEFRSNIKANSGVVSNLREYEIVTWIKGLLAQNQTQSTIARQNRDCINCMHQKDCPVIITQGCSTTAYCHHRALDLASIGLGEFIYQKLRIVQGERFSSKVIVKKALQVTKLREKYTALSIPPSWQINSSCFIQLLEDDITQLIRQYRYWRTVYGYQTASTK